MSSIPGSVGYIYPMFIEPTITWVPSGFSGYIWLDTKIVFKMSDFRQSSEFWLRISHERSEIGTRQSVSIEHLYNIAYCESKNVIPYDLSLLKVKSHDP